MNINGFVIKLLGCVMFVIDVYVNIGLVIGYVDVLLIYLFVCRCIMLIGIRVLCFELMQFLIFKFFNFDFVLWESIYYSSKLSYY